MRLVAVVSLVALTLGSQAVRAASCESLTSLSLSNATVTKAQTVAAGALKPADLTGGFPNASMYPVPALADLPTFCRVTATLRPSADSDIKIEVWLPMAGWNGKFLAVGNGGWAGTISTSVMGVPLSRGYAVASTDTGHQGNGADASFAVNHPEKLIDFGYRSVHEMAVMGKAITKAFYGDAPRRSYWNGCSTGGRQGLTEAQRYPEDFDGIIAGAPANYMTHLQAQHMWTAQAMHMDEKNYIPREKYSLIHNAALQACDMKDGVQDNVLENPRKCAFDPKELECKNGDAPACLTSPQVEAARKMYADVKNPRTGSHIFPGLLPGSELGWATIGGPKPGAIAQSYWSLLVFDNPAWDFKSFDFDADVARAERLHGGVIDAIDPNLRPFFGRGGKLLQYHGWADNQISPVNSVNYYESVLKKVGKSAGDSFRLFMVPGLGHCRDGEGVNAFDSIRVLEQWAEQGKAPVSISASRIIDGRTVRTRPLCPYPQEAVYKGSGSTDDAKNFTCKVVN